MCSTLLFLILLAHCNWLDNSFVSYIGISLHCHPESFLNSKISWNGDVAILLEESMPSLFPIFN